MAIALEIIATLVLSCYFLILTFSFFKFRLVRKQEELEALLGTLKIGKEIDNIRSQMQKEFSPRDYLLPVSFVSILSFIGFFLLLLGWVLYLGKDTELSDGGLIKSMLWSGSDFWDDPIFGREKKSLAIVAWSILGAFISGAQYIYRRYATIDLTPGNFFSLGIRMMLAPIVSLLIAYTLGWDSPDVNSESILVVAFMTGLFPERGLRMLSDKIKHIFPSKEPNEAKNLGLETIQGVSYMHRLRLNEVGIDNLQNLAQFNFLLLIIKTPFPVRILLDWVAQAKLWVEFEEHTPKLKKAGIRSAIDLIEAVKESAKNIEEISKVCELEPLMLEINYRNFERDKSMWLLIQFKGHLEDIKLS